MPIVKSTKKAEIGKNIKTLVRDYKRTGKIGTSKPKSEKAALKQAEAISFSIRKTAKKHRREDLAKKAQKSSTPTKKRK